MPRKSRAATEVVPSAVRASTARLRPPAGLSEAEVAVWRGIVDVMPADFFRQEHVAQLTALCRHQAMAEMLVRRMGDVDPVDDAQTWAKLSAAQVSHSKAALAYSRSLRLTLQAQKGPDTAANAVRQRPEMTLETLRRNYGDDDHATH